MPNCQTCRDSLPLGEFYADPQRVSGHKPDCKSCYRSKARERYSELYSNNSAFRQQELKRAKDNRRRWE